MHSSINLKQAQSLLHYCRGLWDAVELWRRLYLTNNSRPRWTNQRYSCSAASVIPEQNWQKWRQQ
eukprot:scaffold125814_cov47-Cyclotella_meneghiniana.AAC.2